MGQRGVMQGLVSRIAVGVFGLLTVSMILLAVFDEHGVLAVRERKQQLEKLNQEIEKAIEDNERYQIEIEGLRKDPDVIERIGREEWKLIRPGEVMIELPDTSAPSKKDQPTEKDSSKE